MTDSTTQVLLRESDVAEMLDVQPVTLEKWRGTSRGPAYVRVGRLVRYRRDDVDAWIAENRVATRESPAAVPVARENAA